MKVQAKHLNLATTALTKIYDQYYNQGLVSVYLWGSILREEYSPSDSDIDALGIIEDHFPLEIQSDINKALEESQSGLRDLRINLIRLSEINGGQATTRIATVIPPSLLLLEFGNWKHVAGKAFRRVDFLAPILSIEKAIGLNLQVVVDHYLPKISIGDMTKWKSFLKQIMHICHLMNRKNVGFVPFTYAVLERDATAEDRELVTLILQMKKADYREATKDELQMITSFVTDAQSRYCRV